MKKIIWVILLFFSFNTVSFAKIKEASFLKCVDGDTAEFTIGEEVVRYRFIGIDAPELDNKEESIGNKARDFTCEKLKNASEIIIESDDKADSDKYGRKLGWIWADKKLLQKELVENGLAKVAYVYDEYKYVNSLCLYENKAHDKKIGIWENDVNERYCDTVDISNITDDIDYKKITENMEESDDSKLYNSLKKVNDIQEKVGKYASENEEALIRYGFYLIIGIAIVYIALKEFKRK